MGVMKQVVAVRKWSTSVAIVIPSTLLKELRWKVSDIVRLDIQHDSLVVTPVTMPKAPALAPGTASDGAGESEAND